MTFEQIFLVPYIVEIDVVGQIDPMRIRKIYECRAENEKGALMALRRATPTLVEHYASTTISGGILKPNTRPGITHDESREIIRVRPRSELLEDIARNGR